MLVFDLGGTFDVTIVDIGGITFKTVASDGNAELAKDWDDCLVNHVAEIFAGMVPIRETTRTPISELYERCLAAKIALSTKPKAVIPVNHQGNREAITVTKETFEQLTAHLVQQCEDTVNMLLRSEGLIGLISVKC